MRTIKDIRLAPSGEKKIDWVKPKNHTPLLNAIKEEFEKTKPFAGKKIALAVHLEAKTAYLCQVLMAGGAKMFVTGCNPLSTQDDVAAALMKSGANVFAWRNEDPEAYYYNMKRILEPGPDIIIDDGGDLINAIHTDNDLKHLIPNIIGGCEETTTGVQRLKAMQRENQLKIPMIDVNDAKSKCMFDNFFGTKQSVWNGINRTTNLMVAGKNVVVAGFGPCGQGIAENARGQGAHVYICEVNHHLALKAYFQGYNVLPMEEAASIGDIFITVTGCCDVITSHHFCRMKDGAILCNAGHFDVEVDVEWLKRRAAKTFEARKNIMAYTLKNGRTLYVLAEGRLVNLASGDGHPAEIMDMSFAIQALSAQYLANNRDRLEPGVIKVPDEIDTWVAKQKLAAMGVRIDLLTKEQEEYLSSWNI